MKTVRVGSVIVRMGEVPDGPECGDCPWLNYEAVCEAYGEYMEKEQGIFSNWLKLPECSCMEQP